MTRREGNLLASASWETLIVSIRFSPEGLVTSWESWAQVQLLPHPGSQAHRWSG